MMLPALSPFVFAFSVIHFSVNPSLFYSLFRFPESVTQDKELELTIKDLLSPATFTGSSNGARHTIIFDYSSDSEGLVGELTQANNFFSLLSGFTTGLGVAFDQFVTADLILGAGPDFLTITATPQYLKRPVNIQLGGGANELVLLIETVEQLRSAFYSDIVCSASPMSENDTNVFTASLNTVESPLHIKVDQVTVVYLRLQPLHS